MTHVVVSLSDQPDEARSVMHTLNEAGYDESNIEFIESDPESQSFFKRIFQKEGGEEMQAERAMEFLTRLGIPEDEAEDYADQVKKGRSMVLLRCENEREAEKARKLIKHGMQEESGEEPIRSETAKRPESEKHSEIGESERGEQRIQASEEEVRIGKRQTETGGVRVEKDVTEEEVEEEVMLREEDVDVERRDVDRPLDEGEEAFQEEELEVSESREEPVVDKETRVREEVTVSKDTEEHPETIRETVRRENINVKNLTERARPRFEQFEPDLQAHYEETYGDGDRDFDEYSRGYQYGMALAEDERYRGRDWEEVEAEAGKEWKSQENSNWDNFKEAARYGWYRIRGKEEEYQRRPE